MRIKIKKSYHEETKEILKKLRPYTNYRNSFYIVFETDKDNNIKRIFIKWMYDNKELKTGFKTGYYEKQGGLLSEIIEALNLANHNIYFKIQGGF